MKLLKKIIKNVMLKVNLTLSFIMSKTRWTADIYYLLFSNKFSRQHQAVLKARLKYYKNGQKSNALLRRNTHRIEKGLSMKPMRDTFAVNYILETVNGFNSYSIGSGDINSLMWSRDVLNQYFSLVKGNTIVNKAKERFYQGKIYKELKEINSHEEGIKAPFRCGSRKTDTTFDELLSLASARHSVRWYIDKCVSQKDIDESILIASKAPSACNRQPFKYIVLDQHKQASKIADLAMGTGGFAQNIRHLAVVVGDLSAYPYERDRNVIYIDASLSSMLLMLAFKSKGIDSCPINWPDIESRERRIAKELNLELHERVVMLIAFGYADDTYLIPYSEKKSVEELKVTCPID